MTDRKGETIEYIEATIGDIELANRLADRFLERSFAELPERTNVLLEQIIGGVRNLAEFQIIELFEVRFTRKDVRRWSTFGDTQLKQHLARLVDYEVSQSGIRRPLENHRLQLSLRPQQQHNYEGFWADRCQSIASQRPKSGHGRGRNVESRA